MIEKLRNINEKLIKLNKNNKDEYEKQVLISKLLKENDCFLKIDVEYAYAILRDLGIDEKDLKRVYYELI
mgnify:FL=1